MKKSSGIKRVKKKKKKLCLLLLFALRKTAVLWFMILMFAIDRVAVEVFF